MIQLQGDWFDGKTSEHRRVLMQVSDWGQVSILDKALNQSLLQLEFSALEISSRIGSTPRYIYFPQGQKLETQDHASVDALLQQHRPSLFNTLAHRLESHLQFVLLTLVAVIGISWWTVQYGLPLASKVIANALPQRVMNIAAEETLQILDKTHFEPTQLDEPTRARVLAHFAPAIAEYPDLHIQVVFRAGGDIGANAFALPDGTVVFTDEIVKLSHSDDELLAVLAHEIGHVKYRHALRSTIQGSVLSFAVSMLTGDISAAGNLLAALPLILTNMSYSRDFEREADHNALVYLDEHKIPRHYFVDLMERLTYQAHCDALIARQPGSHQEKSSVDSKSDSDSAAGSSSSAAADSVAAAQGESDDQIDQSRKALCDKLIAEDKDNSHKIMDFFASHPATEERLREFRQ